MADISQTKPAPETSTLNRLAQKLEQLKNQGCSILDLTESNPTRCGFHYLDSSLLEALAHPKNLVYEPHPRGLAVCREAIARYYAEKDRIISPDDIIITANTSEAYAFLFKLLLKPGDSILAPQPSYPLLGFLAEEHAVHLIRYPLKSRNRRWQCSGGNFGRDLSEKPKAVLFVNPNNPTGNYVSHSETELLQRVDPKRHLPVISDEVFLDYAVGVRENDAPSLAGNTERLTFTLSGISKVLGLPQMKLSWIVVSGPEELKQNALDRLDLLSDHYLSASTPIQNACPAWFKIRSKIQTEIRTRISENYAFLENYFAAPGPVEVPRPGGGWCLPLRFPSRLTDESWALHILEHEQALTHPGYLFDFEEESYLILSLLPKPALFREGLERISRCIARAG